MKNLLLTSAHSKSNVAVLLSAIALMLLSFGKANAQNNYLVVSTETHTSGKAFENYMVTVYQDLMNNGDFSPIDQYTANSSRNKFKMQYGTAYMIDFATPADLHYTVQFDTKTATAQSNSNREFEIDIDFDKLDVNQYPNTIEMVNFNNETQQFAFTPQMDAKVQQAAVK